MWKRLDETLIVFSIAIHYDSRTTPFHPRKLPYVERQNMIFVLQTHTPKRNPLHFFCHDWHAWAKLTTIQASRGWENALETLQWLQDNDGGETHTM